MKTATRELEQIGEGIHCANLPRFDLLLELRHAAASYLGSQ